MSYHQGHQGTQTHVIYKKTLEHGIVVILDYGMHKYAGKTPTNLYRVMVGEEMGDGMHSVFLSVHFYDEQCAKDAYDLAASAKANGPGINMHECRGAVSTEELEPDTGSVSQVVEACARFREEVGFQARNFPQDSVLRLILGLMDYSCNLRVRVQDPDLKLVGRKIDSMGVSSYSDVNQPKGPSTILLLKLEE